MNTPRSAAGSTVTVKLHRRVVPRTSVAVQLTGVEPIGKVEPEAGWQVTVTGPPQVLDTRGVGNVTTAPAVEVVSTVWFSGQLICRVPVVLSRVIAPGGVTSVVVLIG